ncbi:hypothetical protein CC86DRAFT_392856 [Ophiobolus disseminans]|uniref:T6SS Phospholipase effector Tle1-like catalytic domain-containing protein n=1 Tax=Ophiobolus disseminans TaxID=1469910 RepID=A0A6A7A7A0_9PLEO|nr:hypothetical protein CC86DRAFT_392856 [Ophiobolus disseminans]
MSVAPSRARSRSRAPSTMAQMNPQPIVIEAPSRRAKSPLIIDVPVRARSRSVGRNGPLSMEAPGLSGGRGMFKRLIVACDGTWNDSDDGNKNGKLAIPSNITRISRAIKAVSQDGVQQIVNYHSGLGTEGTKFSRFLGGTTGKGLSDNVREAYSFLANNYHHGDEIFLLGFSRGAFTARSIGGLIGEIGLLTKKGLNALPEVYEDIQHRRDDNYVPAHPDIPFTRKPSASDPRYKQELERRGLTRLDIPIKVIGVWDTVGSLGIPRIGFLQRAGLQMRQSKATTFYDTKLSQCVENAFQALALDEQRSSFSPAIWEKPEGNRTTLRQVWFPGAHANVGGGYDDEQIANISLAWMMSQLEPFLDMRDEYLFEQDEQNEKYYKKMEGEIRPWSFGKLYSELTGLFALGGSTVRKPGHYTAVEPFNGRHTDRPLRQTNEYIHPSVRTRFRREGPGILDRGTYEARGLTENYKLVVDYGPDIQKVAGDAEVFWKIRSRDTNGVRVLPEAPLWRLERELARKDPRTYDYYKRPPATASTKKSRRAPRPVSADMSHSRAPSGVASPSPRKMRRDTFSPRSTFPAEDRGARRSSVTMQEPRRSKSRARSASFDDRETEIREEMPHRREKDRAWWDGIGKR